MKGWLIVSLLLITNILFAQNTRVRGKVTDAKTGEVVPLASIVFKGTTIGIATDFDGAYFLETRESVSEVQASLIGYVTQTVKIKPGMYNEVNFVLEPQTFDLDEVSVTPGVNPAHAILRNVIHNKVRNNHTYLPGYACNIFNKWMRSVKYN